MWYKIAKYGTLWDRLGPESEEEIDKILDESTYRTKITEDGKEKEIRKVDFKKLDQLLKESVLSKKGVLNKIVEFHDPKFGNYGGISIPNSGSVPLIQTKILNIPILVRRYMDKVIHINPKYTYNYIWTRSVIKHERSHAISAAVLPQSAWRNTESPDSPEREFYLGHDKLTKNDLGSNIQEAEIITSFNAIREAVFHDKIPSFEDYLKKTIGPNYIKEYFIENLDKSTLRQREEKIIGLFRDFQDTIKWPSQGTWITSTEPKPKLLKLSKEEMIEIRKIFSKDFSSSVQIDPWDKEDLEKRHNELTRRSKLLGPGVDIYYANPEETRSHLAENKELFSLNSVKEFYDRLNYNTPKEEHIPEFLDLVKTIFNEAVIYGDSNQFYHIDNYYKILGQSSFYDNDIYFKRYDKKFQRQLAKILNENYQKIKTYFNSMLDDKYKT